MRHNNSQTNRLIDAYGQYSVGVERAFASIGQSQNELMADISIIGENDSHADVRDLKGIRFFRSNAYAGLRCTFNNATDRIFQMFGNYDYVRKDLIMNLNFKQRLIKSIVLEFTIDGPVIIHSEEMK